MCIKAHTGWVVGRGVNLLLVPQSWHWVWVSVLHDVNLQLGGVREGVIVRVVENP